MKSHTTASFRKAVTSLPKNIQTRARAGYRKFRSNPSHRSLQFKKVHQTRPIYSARISDDYRVVGTTQCDDIVWFWIGKHEQYERLLKQL